MTTYHKYVMMIILCNTHEHNYVQRKKKQRVSKKYRKMSMAHQTHDMTLKKKIHKMMLLYTKLSSTWSQIRYHFCSMCVPSMHPNNVWKSSEVTNFRLLSTGFLLLWKCNPPVCPAPSSRALVTLSIMRPLLRSRSLFTRPINIRRRQISKHTFWTAPVA